MIPTRNTFLFAIFVEVLIMIIWLQFYNNNVHEKRQQNLDFETNNLKEIDETAIDMELESLLYDTDLSFKDKNVKYVLIWTQENQIPVMFLGLDNEVFVKKNCTVNNCFITYNRIYFRNITEFDAVLFHGPEVLINSYLFSYLPQTRSPGQNYVFVSIESSDNYPVCDNRYDGFFNVSWTYKLNSDIFYAYLIVRNEKGDVIGPKQEMHWLSIDEMKPINDTIKEKLNSKTKLAAWLVSNCNAANERHIFVEKVQAKLKQMGTNMSIDVYGRCGTMECAVDETSRCLEVFEQDYYFYFSFENTFAEDYVTEKILHALQHYTVPVVFGTANYSRFMPDGIYLHANNLGVDALAEKMLEIVNDKEKYYTYFKWINHYSYYDPEESLETDPYCNFCAAMNDDGLMKRTSVIQHFTDWWNPKQIRFC